MGCEHGIINGFLLLHRLSRPGFAKDKRGVTYLSLESRKLCTQRVLEKSSLRTRITRYKVMSSLVIRRASGTRDVEGPMRSEERCRWELFSTMDLQRETSTKRSAGVSSRKAPFTELGNSRTVSFKLLLFQWTRSLPWAVSKSCVVLIGELKHDIHGKDSAVLAQMMVQ